MAKLGINTGSSPDAGDGDSLLMGALKINSNFDEIYNSIGDGTNLHNSIGYASTAGIATYASVSRVVVKDDGSTVGTAGTIDFGTGLSVSAVSAGVVTVTASVGTSSQWVTTAAGIHTLSNVGVGTTNPTSALTVVGSGTSTSQLYVTGVSTFVGIPRFDGGISFSDDSSGLPTAATRNIEVSLGFTQRFIFRTNKVEFFSFSDYYGSSDHFIFEISKTGDVTAAGNLSISGITTTSGLNVGTGGTVITTTAAGLVGINTTNPTSALTVKGDVSVSGIATVTGSVRVGVDTSAGVILTSPNGTKYQLFVEDDGTLNTIAV